jgi:diguanylate cyclase (GGDEF)-like protein/PAS domain S-box-containing protein
MQNHETGTALFWENRYRIYYIALFIGFGIVIAILTSMVNYRLATTNIDKVLQQNAEEELSRKQAELTAYTTGLEEYISAISKSETLNRYILNPTEENRSIAVDLLHTLASTDFPVMQLRFIDQNGMERLRVNKDPGQVIPAVVPEDKLQDKSDRYYYKEVLQLPPNSFWYSRLDLNIENQQIEIPLKPVLRIATPVYIYQRLQGMVVLNAHAKDFLSHFSQSSFFHIALIDQEGYYLTDHDTNRSWSRYLQTGYTLRDTLPSQAGSILAATGQTKIEKYGDVFAASLATYLPKDKAILVLTPKAETLQSMQDERQQGAGLIILIIFALSLPLSFFISRLPAQLYQKLSRQNAVLTEYFELIDTNIISCITDLKGNFLDISSAFASISGYDKNTLLKSNYELLQHPDTTDEFYTHIWNGIAAGQVWNGEIQHTNRKGDTYWTEVAVYPKRNEHGIITACSAIHQDITDRKNIEKLSVTDDLTGLYNRRFFNITIARELNRAQRENKLLSFAMLDVDYFKQYNDHYGHQKGDEVLTAIGQTLSHKLGRGSDSCFRLGGEEYGIIFVDLSPADSLQFIEDIRISIEKIGIEHRWSDVAEVVTVSAGLLSVTPGPGVTVDSIYRKADEALYQAKSLGRNQVVPALLDAVL